MIINHSIKYYIMTTEKQYIFHLSDLHIRNGDKIQSRYDEYKLVFDNTIISIKNKIDELSLTFNEHLIIITGDVFHNKNVIGSYGLLLYRTFIPAELIWAKACKSNVDLPIPGSPPKSTTPPGTRPPPRTRSNSSTPVLNLGKSSAVIADSFCRGNDCAKP